MTVINVPHARYFDESGDLIAVARLSEGETSG